MSLYHGDGIMVTTVEKLIVYCLDLAPRKCLEQTDDCGPRQTNSF